MGLIKRGQLSEAGTFYIRENVPQIERQPLIIEPQHETPSPQAIEEAQPELPPVEIPEETLSTETGPSGEEAISYAKAEAESIIRKAMEEASAIKEQAKSDGLEEAKRMAEETASDKVKEAIATLNEAVVERKKIIKDAEGEILRLALKTAEQIVRSEVTMHRDVTLNIVSDAISRVNDREQVIVRVNREDIETIKKYKDRIGSVVDGIKSLSIIEDATVEPGGCIIETNLGYVDARISTKLAAIEEAFRKVS